MLQHTRSFFPVVLPVLVFYSFGPGLDLIFLVLVLAFVLDILFLFLSLFPVYLNLSATQFFMFGCSINTLVWRRGVVVSGVGLINEVNRHRARLVLGWVTVCGRVNHLGM